MSDEANVFSAAIQNFLSPIADLLVDPAVTEILINGPHEVFVERGGFLTRTNHQFTNEDELQAAVNSIAQSVNRAINGREPRLDARLPDGSRIHAVLPPIARNGTTVSIRKFSKTKMTLKEYIQRGAVSVDAAQFLDLCVFLGKNIIVSGGTGSGKTTLLSVLTNRTPKGKRLLLIEDSSELQIDYEHIVRFETRQADQQGHGEITMQHLLKSALRLRPDRIIVGEVRGSEALELMNAMNTGHNGSMGTLHANSPEDAIVRLEGLAMSGDAKMGEKVIRHQLASAVNIVIQISRFSDGSRRVQTISEVLGLDHEGNYNISPIYDIGTLERGADGKLVGELKPTGNLPSFMEEIEANKIPFPRSKFQGNQAA